MTVWVWPNEFKHLDEWIDRVIAGLPSEFEPPLPSLELVDDEWQRRRLRVRTYDAPKACFERLDGVVPCGRRMGTRGRVRRTMPAQGDHLHCRRLRLRR